MGWGQGSVRWCQWVLSTDLWLLLQLLLLFQFSRGVPPDPLGAEVRVDRHGVAEGLGPGEGSAS